MRYFVFLAVFLFTGFIGMCQNQLKTEFESYLSASMNDGIVEFNSFCVIDSMYYEDEATSEIKLKVSRYSYKLSKAITFNVVVNEEKISAPFVRIRKNDAGKVIGEINYTLEFVKKGDAFEVSGVIEEEKIKWNKVGDCWSK